MESSIATTQIQALETRFDSEGQPRVENRHPAWAVVSDDNHRIAFASDGSLEALTFFRSSAKPFQALPLVLSGLHRELTQEELAVACASHVANAEQLRHVEALLDKAGLGQDSLQCGPHMPPDMDMQAKLQAAGQKAQPIHNNCSGKHAGMLFYCVRNHLDPATYLAFDHPLQRLILEQIARYADMNARDIPRSIDGCGAPVFYMPLSRMALLYTRLASEPVFEPIRQAMTRHPELVGGEGRIDTVIMQSFPHLLAKVGADGVLCVAHMAQRQGLALKMADGSNEIRNKLILPLLAHIGWIDPDSRQIPALTPHWNMGRTNTQGKTIGEIRIGFEPAR